MTRPLIYIASPYTLGDCAANVARAMHTWHELWKMGFAPICPLWSHFQQLLTPLAYADWLEYDLHILSQCDAVLRLSGESAGADRETRCARDTGILVFVSIEDLLLHFGRLNLDGRNEDFFHGGDPGPGCDQAGL